MKWIRQQGERYRREQRIRKAYAEYWPEKKQKKTSNVVLAVVIITVIAYTIASFWITYVRGVSIDPTLTTCFYTFFGSELLLLAGLKTSKILKGYENTYNAITIDQNDSDAVG